jgi:hypothetical protein
MSGITHFPPSTATPSRATVSSGQGIPIGISLNASALMKPLKSVSGVLVAADRESHDFDIEFDFCTGCAGQECRERIQSVLFDTLGGQ